MKKKLIGVIFIYLMALTDYMLLLPYIENINAKFSREGILAAPLMLSALFLLKDFIDVTEKKYEKLMLVPTALNILFLAVYARQLYSYSLMGLF